MDTNIWGPQLWALLSAIARATDASYRAATFAAGTQSPAPAERHGGSGLSACRLGRRYGSRRTWGCDQQPCTREWHGSGLMGADAEMSYKRAFLLLVYSLQYVMPCRFCRDSYRVYIRDLPPERFGDAREFVWLLKNRVNEKLGKQNCGIPYDKYVKRLECSTSVVDPLQIWDLLDIFAANYPRADTAHEDPEYEAKRAAYRVFLGTLARCVRDIPGLQQLARFVHPASLTPADIADRAAFRTWVWRQRDAWAAWAGLTSAERTAITMAQQRRLRHTG